MKFFCNLQNLVFGLYSRKNSGNWKGYYYDSGGQCKLVLRGKIDRLNN